MAMTFLARANTCTACFHEPLSCQSHWDLQCFTMQRRNSTCADLMESVHVRAVKRYCKEMFETPVRPKVVLPRALISEMVQVLVGWHDDRSKRVPEWKLQAATFIALDYSLGCRLNDATGLLFEDDCILLVRGPNNKLLGIELFLARRKMSGAGFAGEWLSLAASAAQLSAARLFLRWAKRRGVHFNADGFSRGGHGFVFRSFVHSSRLSQPHRIEYTVDVPGTTRATAKSFCTVLRIASRVATSSCPWTRPCDGLTAKEVVWITPHLLRTSANSNMTVAQAQEQAWQQERMDRFGWRSRASEVIYRKLDAPARFRRQLSLRSVI